MPRNKPKAKDTTEQLQARLEDLELQLREREKELSCIKRLGHAIEVHDRDLDRILLETAEILTESWLHVEACVARITLDDASYETGNIERCVAVQRAPLYADGEQRGTVEVGYTRKRPEQDEGRSSPRSAR